MKKIFYIIALLPMAIVGQTTTQNYIKTITYKDSTSTSISNPTLAQAAQSVTYFDGLGRPMQQIAHKQSGTGNDLITHIEYDALGRQEMEFLPVVDLQSLDFRTISSVDVINYYSHPHISSIDTTASPFSVKGFDGSPLQRISMQTAPGDDWTKGNGHEVRFDYQTNEDEEVRLFGVNLTESDYTPSLIYDYRDYYVRGTLYKTITKDENWTAGGGDRHTTQEFKDKEGRVILKRTFASSINEDGEVYGAHDTYYVYDDYGNLTYVIPPLVNTRQSIDTDILDGLCYQYKYDYRNRMIAKKLPGKQWEYIAYNSQDLPVATGPAQSPWGANTWGWLITKYDAFGRVVYTGWKEGTVNDAERESIQNALGSNWAESFVAGGPDIDGVRTSYTNTTSPTQFKLLTVNYYDNYNYRNAPTPPTNIEGQPIMNNAKGLATGSWVRVLDYPGNITAERSYSFYDSKGRVIRSFKANHLGGYNKVDSKLDFSGKAQYTYTFHRKTQTDDEIVIKDNYTYTPQDRLLLHTQKINDLDEELINKNDYDDLGQLISKQVGGQDIVNYVGYQKVDYSYNIRGWLTGINKVENLSESSAPNDFFAFKINYNEREHDPIYPALYNGNISETLWRSGSDNVVRKYSYSYDAINRLKDAVYQKPNLTVPVTNMYNERIGYDKNGNIAMLNRRGDCDFDEFNVGFEIDDLTYSYDPTNKNQLMRVQDRSTVTLGFKDDNTTGTDTNDDYTYDANGNMLSDSNKDITSIIYNHLNLPTRINILGNYKIEYLYNALGQKVRKSISEDGGDTAVTDYLDGFQYLDSKLIFFPHAEGYVNVVGEPTDRYYFNYVYNYVDHLGNVRLSYGYDPKTYQVKIMEENNYYPFGLKHTNYNSTRKAYEKDEDHPGRTVLRPVDGMTYKYKYNGKEYQDELGLNEYDYGARNYDPAIGRWMNIDPLAEQYRKWSPYCYAVDNPIYFVDPDGMSINPTFIDDPKANSGSTKSAYITTVEKATGNTYQVTSDPLINGGNVVFSQVAQGPVTEEQQAFIEEYGAVVNSKTVVNQEIVSNDASVSVGSFQDNQMDMADVAQFDKAGKGGCSSAGALIHETVEQLNKAEMGIPKGSIGEASYDAQGNLETKPDFDVAHTVARKAEDRVNGNTRTDPRIPHAPVIFTEKNGKHTKQVVVPAASGGTVNVMKKQY